MGRVCQPVLPDLSPLRGAISLEPRSMRVRHRRRVSAAGGSGSHLREPDTYCYPHGEARQHRHLFGEEVARNYQDEMGNRYNIRIQGTRIKHTMGPVSIKRYDKFGLILRIETTVNDVSFFKHYRQVEHRNGSKEMKYAAMLKTIYSLPALRQLLVAANRRYLEFLSALEDDSNGSNKLNKISRAVEENGRSYRGFIFDDNDQELFQSLIRGEFNIRGFQQKSTTSTPGQDQRPHLTTAQTPTGSWPDQEDRPNLQVLSNKY